MRKNARAQLNTVFTVFLALYAGTLAQAQDDEGKVKAQRGPWFVGIDGGAVHQFETDLQDEEGSFEISRFFIEPSVGYAWDRRTSVSVSVGFGDAYYNFSPDAEIDGRQPWGRIRDYRISVPIRFAPSGRSSVIIIPTVRSWAEAGANLSDGLSEGVLAGAGWRFSDQLYIGPGFGFFTNIDGDDQFFPILIIDWDITERLNLSTGSGIAATQGPGLSLNYSLNDRWTLGFTGRYERLTFALDKDGAVPGGIGEDRSLPMLLTLDYEPWPMARVSALVGVEFDGKLRLEDQVGVRLSETEYDPAPVLGIAFSARF